MQCRTLLIMSFLLPCLSVACKDVSGGDSGTGGAAGATFTAGGDGGTGGGTSATFTDEVPPPINLSCTESPCNRVVGTECLIVTDAPVSVTGIGGCSLREGTLEVQFGTGYQTVGIYIEGMTGAGTYHTDNEGKILVKMTAGDPDNPTWANTTENPEGLGEDTAGNEVPYPARDYPCTIVVQTDLPAAWDGSVPFGIAFDVTCPMLGSMGNFPQDCVAAPTSFHASVAECQ